MSELPLLCLWEKTRSGSIGRTLTPCDGWLLVKIWMKDQDPVWLLGAPAKIIKITMQTQKGDAAQLFMLKRHQVVCVCVSVSSYLCAYDATWKFPAGTARVVLDIFNAHQLADSALLNPSASHEIPPSSSSSQLELLQELFVDKPATALLQMSEVSSTNSSPHIMEGTGSFRLIAIDHYEPLQMV